MKTLILIVLAPIIFSCEKEVTSKLNTSTTSNAVTTHINYVLPIDQDDSYNSCTGEHVHLTGNIRIESTDVITRDLVNSTVTIHYDSLRGIGSLSHMIYHG